MYCSPKHWIYFKTTFFFCLLNFFVSSVQLQCRQPCTLVNQALFRMHEVRGAFHSTKIPVWNFGNFSSPMELYRVFSLTWPASMQISWNKRKRLHKKRVQLPDDWFGTPTWRPFYRFGTPISPQWRNLKTFYSACTDPTQATARLVIVLVRRKQKIGTGDNNIVKWEGAFRSIISLRPTEVTKPVKVDQLQSWYRIFRSD